MTAVDDIERALERKPDAAIVVTAPHTHALVARTLLDRGIPALVEKPLALNANDALGLIELARGRDLVLGVGLHLLFASYLRHFRSLWRDRAVASAQLIWLDCETEMRYGEIKRMDASTPKVHDVFPHLWTIMRVFWPAHAPSIRDAESLPGGGARLDLTVGDVEVVAQIGRRAPARARCINVTFKDGGTSALDFTSEPGACTLDGRPAAGDPDWNGQPTPLSAEVSSYLAAVADKTLAGAWPCLARNVLGSVTGAEAAAARLAGCEARKLADRVAVVANPVDDPDIRALLIDNLAPELSLSGIRISEPAQLVELVRTALSVLDKTPEGLAGESAPTELLDALTKSRFLRDVSAAAGTLGKNDPTEKSPNPNA